MTSKKTRVTTEPLSGETTVVTNIDETQVVINETKLENILLKHQKALNSGADWKTPLGLLIAIGTAFLTAEFNKDFLGFSKFCWQAIFVIVFLGSIAWLFRSLVLRYKNRNENIESLILKIKDEKNNG